MYRLLQILRIRFSIYMEGKLHTHQSPYPHAPWDGDKPYMIISTCLLMLREGGEAKSTRGHFARQQYCGFDQY